MTTDLLQTLALLAIAIWVFFTNRKIGYEREQRRNLGGRTAAEHYKHEREIKELRDWADAADDHIQRTMAPWDPKKDAAYTTMLNRRVTVENILAEVATNKRPALTPEQCRDLARHLGTPDHKLSKELFP